MMIVRISRILRYERQHGWTHNITDFAGDLPGYSWTISGSLSLPGVQTYAMIFSEDGDYIATANSDAKVRIFQTIDQSEVATLEGKAPSAIISLDFSPDGTLLAGGTAGG